MTRTITPIASLARRLPEAGRIRTGVKSGKAMKALAEFRFTSHDQEALAQIAGMYGGEVKPWSDPKAAAGQFECITDAPEIRVVLPPDPLGGTPIYELWGGGGCERRCDGVTCTTQQAGPDGPEPVDIDCICVARNEMACNVTTRLNVILPEVRFAGVWRLDTKSFNAAQELPGMVDMIQSQQARGLAYATLSLKQRRSVQAGQTRKFVVPQLGVPASIEQLAAGGSRLGALPVSAAPELGPGEGGGTLAGQLPSPDDDEIHEAEVVDEVCSDETFGAIRARASELDPIDQDALKAWVEGQGWTFTRRGLTEEQALAVLAWRPAEVPGQQTIDGGEV